MPEAPQHLAPASLDEVRDGLASAGYLSSEAAALVSFLAYKLGKPVLVEGPAGVGKTELAKALSRYSQRSLVRLQCYEGLDEAKALYEWNYRKQLLRIQTEAAGTAWQDVQEDIFSEDFLMARPLLTAISVKEPVVLLIDEIDKTDQEFEAMLLEILSDFQISIPELAWSRPRRSPLVVLTSNNTRELTEALKRRCLYLWLDYPDAERELEIVRLHVPELPETIMRRLIEIIHMVRNLDLKKPPSIAESIDWARAMLLLGATDIDRSLFDRTMSIIVKHRTDLDVVAERVGVKLDDGVLGQVEARVTAAPCTAGSRRESLPGWLPSSCASARSCARRGEGRHGRAARRIRRAREVSWTEREDFREALAATLAKSQEDRRVFELMFDRSSSARSRLTPGARPEGDPLPGRRAHRPRRPAAPDRGCDPAGQRGEMSDLARLAVAAFGGQGESSGVIGVDVQRIRRTLDLVSRAATATRPRDSTVTPAALRGPPAP